MRKSCQGNYFPDLMSWLYCVTVLQCKSAIQFCSANLQWQCAQAAHIYTGTPVYTGICGKSPVERSYFVILPVFQWFSAGTMRYLAVWQKVNNALIYTKRSSYNVIQLKISKDSGWNFNFLKIVVENLTFFLEIMVEIHNTGYCNITDTLLLPCIGR